MGGWAEIGISINSCQRNQKQKNGQSMIRKLQIQKNDSDINDQGDRNQGKKNWMSDSGSHNNGPLGLPEFGPTLPNNCDGGSLSCICIDCWTGEALVGAGVYPSRRRLM